MSCFTCKGGHLNDEDRTFVATLKNCVIIVKHVPSLVCQQCGEIYYSNEVMKKLENIVDTMEKLVEEVAIVEYSKMVS